MFKPIVDVRARVYDMQHEAETKHVMTVEQNGETNAIGNALPYTEQDCGRNVTPIWSWRTLAVL